MTPTPVQPGSLMNSLQAEVGAEASPMMRFLVRNARAIVFGVLLLVAAAVAFWAYSWQADKKRVEEEITLGRIITIADARQRLAKLEAFLPDAPDSVRRGAWFAFLDAAYENENQEALYRAWEAIGGFSPIMDATAARGMANALTAQGKRREALAVLDKVSASLRRPDITDINMRIVLLAEHLGDYERALLACDAIIAAGENPLANGAPGTFTDPKFWKQKKTELAQKFSRTDSGKVSSEPQS